MTVLVSQCHSQTMEVVVWLSVLYLFVSVQAVTQHNCGLIPADFVFLFDSSGSETTSDFRKQVNFLRNFSSQFTIGPNDTQFSSVTFSTNVINNFFLNRYGSQHDLQGGVNKIHYINGETNTHLALNYARMQSLNAHNGARPGVAKYVVVLTDGKSNEEPLTIQAANALKALPNVTVIAIGIGDKIDSRELQAIATDNRHVFTVSNFDLLHNLGKELKDTTCTVCGDLPADIAFLLDSSGSEGNINFQQQINFASIVTNEFNVSPNDTRVAAATFSTYSHSQFQFCDYSTKPSVLQALQKIHYIDGETRTDLGLNTLTSMFSHACRHHTGHGHSHHDTITVPNNENAKKIAVVLTDGRSNEPDATLHQAQSLKRRGVEVFVIGIGSNVDPVELRGIASHNDHVFTVDSFRNLNKIHGKVVDEICQLRIPPPTTTPKPTTPTTTTTTTTRPTTTMTTTTVKPECGAKPADIVFVLDSSESETEVNFNKMKTFVYNFAKKFEIGPNNVQFSSVTFSSMVRNDFFLNTNHRRGDVLHAINNLDFMGAGTNTSYALRFVHDNSFLPEHGGRPNATHIVIVITDGQSSNPTLTAKEANKLKQLANVFSIGIGPKIDRTELANIASNKHPFTVDNFDILHTIQESLENAACS